MTGLARVRGYVAAGSAFAREGARELRGCSFFLGFFYRPDRGARQSQEAQSADSDQSLRSKKPPLAHCWPQSAAQDGQKQQPLAVHTIGNSSLQPITAANKTKQIVGDDSARVEQSNPLQCCAGASDVSERGIKVRRTSAPAIGSCSGQSYELPAGRGGHRPTPIPSADLAGGPCRRVAAVYRSERQRDSHVLFRVRIGCRRSGLHLKTGLLVRWSWLKPLKKNEQDDSQTFFKAPKIRRSQAWYGTS